MLRPENGTFDTPGYHDGYARQKWFYQAQIESPAMFRRTPGAGSLYWLSTRDATGAYLDGSRSYTLAVPLPVPAGLFWSITVYDARTAERDPYRTGQGGVAVHVRARRRRPNPARRAALRADGPGRRCHRPLGPDGPGSGVVRLLPHLRAEGPAFDGTWRLPDFQPV